MAQKIAPCRARLVDFVTNNILDLAPVGSREIEHEVEKLREQGRTILPVYGYPVVQAPEFVWDVAREAAKESSSPPSNGLPELRQSLARALSEQYGSPFDPNREILVTSGAMNSLHVILTTLLEPGDEVLLLTPCYFFGGLVQIRGAQVVTIPTDQSCGYAIDFEQVRRHITEKTKVIILSSPVNPTGYVYSRQDVEQFLSIAEDHNLLLVSDESYDRQLYDGEEHFSPFHYPEGRKRAVLVKSFTKGYALHNWRVGYLVANPELIPHFRKVLEWTVLYCPFVNQKVAQAVLDGPQEWLFEVFQQFEQRRNQLVDGIRELDCYSWMLPRGGPFLFLNVERCDENSARWASQILHSHGVPAVPGRYFHSQPHVRIPFGGTEQTVGQLVSALVDYARAAAR